jgi:hypothetical protein
MGETEEGDGKAMEERKSKTRKQNERVGRNPTTLCSNLIFGIFPCLLSFLLLALCSYLHEIPGATSPLYTRQCAGSLSLHLEVQEENY